MESIKQNKILISAFIVTFIVFIWFFFLRSDGSTDVNIDMNVSSSYDPTIGAEVIRTLAQLHSLQIDQSLFTSDAWMSLKDISVPLPTEVPGKSDLFGPLGSR